MLAPLARGAAQAGGIMLWQSTTLRCAFVVVYFRAVEDEE